jgi:hypothetical protein
MAAFEDENLAQQARARAAAAYADAAIAATRK